MRSSSVWKCFQRRGGATAGLAILFAGAAQAASLSYQLGDRGITNLTCNGQALSNSSGMGINTAYFRRADGSTYLVDGNTGLVWSPRAGNTVTANEPWGKVSCTYAQVGDGVRLDITVLNSTTETLTLCDIGIQTLLFPNLGPLWFWQTDPGQFGQICEPGFGRTSWPSGGGRALPMVQGDYATGCVGLAQSAFPDGPAALGFADTNTTAILQNSTGDGAIFCRVSMGGIAPGQTQTRRFDLRFAPAGTDPYATPNYLSDIYEKYNASKPMLVQWDDRRPILEDCGYPAAGRAATFQNPRRYTTGQDLRTAAGKIAFRAEMLAMADVEIAAMRRCNAQGVVFWSTEGIEEPWAMYGGDPTRITLAPEMEYKGTSTVATVDAFFKKITAAGFRVGQCLRPQDMRYIPTDLGSQFKPTVDGTITRLRVFSSFKEINGVHTARLWRDSDGQLIGGPYQWTYGGTDDQWVELDIPDVAVTSNTEYTVTVSGTVTNCAFPLVAAPTDAWTNNAAHLAYRTRGVYTNETVGPRPTTVHPFYNFLRDVVFVPAGSSAAENLYGAVSKPEGYKTIFHFAVADPAQNLIDKIKYCQNRWGSTLFYVDSSVDAAGNALKGDVWQRVQAACPDVLVMPENQCADAYASSAPLDWFGHGVFKTPRNVRAVWPGAFTAIHNVGGTGFTTNQIPFCVEGVKQGDILLYQGGAEGVITQICQQAGSPPSAKITGPANNTTFPAGASIAITADASDRDGTVTNVEFYYSTVAGGRVYLGQASKAPYTCVFKQAPVGRYVLSVHATDNAGLDRWPAQVVVNVLNDGATPFFAPIAGSYPVSQSVTIGTAAKDATIRYTTDGSIPSRSHGTVYTGPVVIGSNTTLKARACKAGLADTAVAIAVYGIQCARPEFTPWTVSSDSTQAVVTISSDTVGATIRYTTDGSTPSRRHGTVYSAPVKLDATATLKAIACKNGMPDSAIAQGTYYVAVVGSALANGSFETPVLAVSTFRYNLVGATNWTFNARSGIQRNGSVWGATNAADGVQTAFLQGENGKLGKISQPVNFQAGTYAIGFQAAQRSSQIQLIRVSVDGVQVGAAITPTSNSFAGYTSANFTVTAGRHTIAFEATDGSGDKSSFLDLVTINGIPPTPSAR